MLPTRRRSAFAVLRSLSAGKSDHSTGKRSDSENETSNQPQALITSTPWKRSNCSPNPVICTKVTKVTSSSHIKRTPANNNDTCSEAMNATKKNKAGKLSKANRLRQSLNLSGKKRRKANITTTTMCEVSLDDPKPPKPEKRRRSEPSMLRRRTRASERGSRISVNSECAGNNSVSTDEELLVNGIGFGGGSGTMSRRSTRQTGLQSRPVSTYSASSTDHMEGLEKGVTGQEELDSDKVFQWLIGPVKLNKFFSDVWEKKPLLIKRHQPNYNSNWFSTKEMDRILRQHKVQFSVNLDVTSYTSGKRETHNPQGRAYAPVVWDFYQNGCSVRMLNPQAFSESVWKLNALLQEYFGCFVGSNVYLTPPGSQGFAPHYDDIEAFVIQLEGRKHWRLYNPRTESETLPRYSSSNFSQEEIGEPILDTILEAGDMLYFPRGMIHQAETPEDSHSLHITLSTYQRTSWGDFMEKLIPRALEIAFEEDADFRQGLPLNYMDYTGIANSESDSKQRTEFLRKVEKLMAKLISYAPVDATADQMARSNLYDSLPPVLTEVERQCSVFSDGATWKGNRVVKSATIDGDTEIRLVRKGVARFVLEDSVKVYHSLENSRTYHEVDPQSLDFGLEAGPTIEYILTKFPDYVKVADLPHDDLDFKVDVATVLYEKGILVTNVPLQPKSSD